ncbi:MAG: hypothetical protein M3Y93_06505 [Pseudomonadota bacterium]|nr:hypothetical protein [Pseudomonadota bacterium]
MGAKVTKHDYASYRYSLGTEMSQGVVMRQIAPPLTEEDRLAVDTIRSKGVHSTRELNRAHVLSYLNRGVPEAHIMAVMGIGRTP